jgi:hypothetical protein
MQAIIGVDPHKRVLSAVALDSRGGVLGAWRGEKSRRGAGRSRRGGAGGLSQPHGDGNGRGAARVALSQSSGTERRCKARWRAGS